MEDGQCCQVSHRFYPKILKIDWEIRQTLVVMFWMIPGVEILPVQLFLSDTSSLHPSVEEPGLDTPRENLHVSCSSPLRPICTPGRRQFWAHPFLFTSSRWEDPRDGCLCIAIGFVGEVVRRFGDPAIQYFANRVPSVTTTQHRNPRNLSREEVRALSNVRARSDIVIKPADKYGAVVV